MVGVFGPIEPKSRREESQVAFVLVHFRPRAGKYNAILNSLRSDLLQGKEDPAHREIENILKQIFQSAILASLFPRTQVTITIQEINDDGGLLSACINATSLALSDAGIPLRTLPVSCSSVLPSDGSSLIVSPTSEQQLLARASFDFAFERSVEEGIMASRSSGAFTSSEYWEAIAATRLKAQELQSAFRIALGNRVASGTA